jgi:hypothetical protein
VLLRPERQYVRLGCGLAGISSADINRRGLRRVIRVRAPLALVDLGGAVRYGLRNRFWVESILASVTGVVAVLTIFWSQWIEAVFGVDPDSGNGSAEWLVVVFLMIVTVTLTFSACVEWRRVRLSQR